MPAKPAWFPRIGSIIAELRVLKSDYLDRKAVEHIFGVRERRARQLMSGLPNLQIGNALAIPRRALIERLEEMDPNSRTSSRVQQKLPGPQPSDARGEETELKRSYHPQRWERWAK
jgi:hypothetical protein